MRKGFILYLILVVVLTGCTIGNNADDQVIQTIQQETENVSVSKAIWDKFVERNGGTVQELLGVPQEPELLPLYLDGFKHENPLVRWYSANKSLEYAYGNEKEILINELKNLLKDSDEKVKSAAEFVLSAVTREYRGERFVKSIDGKNVAFYRYHEVAYNDGDIWISTENTKDAWYTYHVDGSITKMTWSPDGSKLCVEYGGRSWHFVSFIDLNIYQTKDVGLLSHIMKYSGQFNYKLVMNPRIDPQVTLLEWSPNSDKMLLFYSFNDDDYKIQSGTAIYNSGDNSFEQINPLPETADEGVIPKKPENFTWDK